MAEILPIYDWTHASAHITNARSKAYPWDEWLDGQIRKLSRGEDFDGPAMSVERVIRTSANRRGIRVRIRVEGESIYLQAHLEDARNNSRGVTKSATKKAVKEARAAKAEGIGNGVAPSEVVKSKAVKRAAKPEPETAVPAEAVKAVRKMTKAAAAPVAAKATGKATSKATNGKATAPNIGAVVNEVVRKPRKLVKA